MRLRHLSRFRRLLVPVGLLIVWQLAALSGVLDQNAVPAPSTVLESWWQWMFGERSVIAWYSGTWFEYVYLSARRVLLGFVLASIAGVGIGLLIGWSKLARDLADPLIQMLRPIPIVAWLPFATLLFGIQDTAAVFLIALGSFFPIVLNAAAGAERTPTVLLRAALMLGTPRRRLLRRVVLPSALPGIMTGLRLGMGLAWVLVIVAEMLAVKGGLGYALWSGYQFIRMDLIVAAMASLALLGFSFDLLLLAISRRLLRWSPTI
jgi:NitT/TauT family transport system permease protein